MRLPSRLGPLRLLLLFFQIFLTYSLLKLEFNTPITLVNPLTREYRQPESPHRVPLVQTRDTYSLMLSSIKINLRFMSNRVSFPWHRRCRNIKSMLAALVQLVHLRKSSTILVTIISKHLLFKENWLSQIMIWISELVIVLEMAREARKWMINTSRRCTVHRSRVTSILRIITTRKVVNRTIGAFRIISSNPSLFHNRAFRTTRHPKWTIIGAREHHRIRQKESSSHRHSHSHSQRLRLSRRGGITTIVVVSVPTTSITQLRTPASYSSVSSSRWRRERMSVAGSVSHRTPKLTIIRPLVHCIFRQFPWWKPQKNQID